MAENDKIEDAVIRKVTEEEKKDVKENPEKDKQPEKKPVDPKLEELISFLRSGSGYLITVTVANNGRLNHHLLTNNFQDMDILKSLKATRDLAVSRLESL